MLRRVIRLVAPLLMVGCLPFVGPNDDGVFDHVSARALWNANGVSNYTVDMRTVCFCVGAGYWKRFTVRANVVTSIVRLDTGTPEPLAVDPPVGAPVDVAFDLVDDAVRVDASQFSAAYHPRWGFPVRASIDFSAGVADDEIQFELANFSPLSR
ncbi:MAG: hypothetical protein IT361_04885 [Gemmatimonadaceae bacterium]|nr:hypothetical protein [Gemmatimonadaceae bacterium]